VALPASSSSSRHLGEFYSDHHTWLFEWLRHRLRHSDNAADLAQDTFLYVLGKPDNIHELRQPRAWLSTIAKGLWVDKLRRQSLEQAYLAALINLPEAEAPSLEERLILLETLAAIDALLDGLPTKARHAFLLSRLEGLGYREIAQRLNVTVSSVEKYIASAIRHCYLIRRAL